LWQERFRGDPGVLDTKVLLDRKPYVVIGVMPRNFEFPLVPGHFNNSRLWVPVSFTQVELTSGAAGWNFGMVGRLKPGITAAQAQSDTGRVAQETMRNYPAFMSSIRIRSVVRSMHEETVEQARELLRTLFFAIAVVLLIACANLAGLLLVRAIRRRREIAVRLALGARANVLLRQAILESLVLSATGGVLGLGLASIALRIGVSWLPDTLPRIGEIGLDWQVVLFAMVLAGLTGVVCGLAPAFAAMRTSVNETLKEGGRTGSAGGHGWLRSILVVGEIAIALALLFASGLLLRSFEKMRAVNLGFRPDHVLSAAYALPLKQYPTQAAVNEFNDELVRRLRQMPGAASAGLSSVLPASGGINNNTFVAEGYVAPQGGNMNLATLATISGDYMQSMGIPLLQGRFFNAGDKSQEQLVTIVNHKLAEHYWHGSDPIGKRMRLGTPEMKTPWLTIVGVVADVKESSPDIPAKEQYYQPVEQFEESLGSLGSPQDTPTGNGGFILVRTAMAPEQMAGALRATVRSIDPQLPLTQVQSMEYTVNESEAPRRFSTALISGFAIAAVLLSVLGIYSVIAFSADLRAQEMAIRMALGSQRSGILSLVFKSALKLALAGCVLGMLGAAAVSRLLQSFLFGVSPFDPMVLSLAAFCVFLLALAASLLPARRAASIDPMKALRAD